MKKTLAMSLALLTFCFFAATSAQAQATGTTDIDINLPDLIILHYFSNVDVTIDAATLGNYLTGTAGDQAVDEGTATGTGFTSDLAITPTGLVGDPAAAVLTLNNAWAVRSISGGATNRCRVAVATTDGTLEHTNGAGVGGTITFTSAVSEGAQAAGTSVDFDPGGLVNPVYGNVVLTLDLSGAIHAGDYLDGTFTLTATNI